MTTSYCLQEPNKARNSTKGDLLTPKMTFHPLPTALRAFTLLELMIVVAILGLLVTIITPAFTLYYQRARSIEALQTLGIFHQSQYVSFQNTQRFGTCETLSSMSPGQLDQWAGGEKTPINSICTNGVGFPLLDNTFSPFVYQTFSGKYSASNTLDPSVPAAQNSPTNTEWFGLKGPSLGACLGENASSMVSGTSLGLSGAPSAGYAYYAMVATANFNGGSDFGSIGNDICMIAFRFAVYDRDVNEEILSSPVVMYSSNQ